MKTQTDKNMSQDTLKNSRRMELPDSTIVYLTGGWGFHLGSSALASSLSISQDRRWIIGMYHDILISPAYLSQF